MSLLANQMFKFQRILNKKQFEGGRDIILPKIQKNINTMKSVLPEVSDFRLGLFFFSEVSGLIQAEGTKYGPKRSPRPR